MQAVQAGGPGGQHQNKIRRAIRATWPPLADRLITAVVRDQRCRRRNRRIALERLAELAAQD